MFNLPPIPGLPLPPPLCIPLPPPQCIPLPRPPCIPLPRPPCIPLPRPPCIIPIIPPPPCIIPPCLARLCNPPAGMTYTEQSCPSMEYGNLEIGTTNQSSEMYRDMSGGFSSSTPSSYGMPEGNRPLTPSSGMPSGASSPGITPGFACSTKSGLDFGSPIEWIPTTSRDAIMFSDRAVVGGYECNGSALWVIRAKYQGDVIPGKFSLKTKVACVPWSGIENCVDNFEVCCAHPEKVIWVASCDGNIPHNAIVAGKTSSGEKLYVGRVHEQHSLRPGKIHPSHGVLYTSFDGKELKHKNYETMCEA